MIHNIIMSAPACTLTLSPRLLCSLLCWARSDRTTFCGEPVFRHTNIFCVTEADYRKIYFVRAQGMFSSRDRKLTLGLALPSIVFRPYAHLQVLSRTPACYCAFGRLYRRAKRIIIWLLVKLLFFFGLLPRCTLERYGNTRRSRRSNNIIITILESTIE